MIPETLFRSHVEGANFLAMEGHIPILHPYKANATQKPINLKYLVRESLNNNIHTFNFQTLKENPSSGS